MQYVRSISGSVSKTWNSINPATLSGAIDVIVVEHEDGTLACSPFHVRFGKFSLLRPHEKKVEFKVNDEKREFPMKLGEGGEAFFVFETTTTVPKALQTSPVVSPVSSPEMRPVSPETPALSEAEPLELGNDSLDMQQQDEGRAQSSVPIHQTYNRAHSSPGMSSKLSSSPGDQAGLDTGFTAPTTLPGKLQRFNTDHSLPPQKVSLNQTFDLPKTQPKAIERTPSPMSVDRARSASPPGFSQEEARTRAINLSKKLWTSNIPSQVTDQGDLMLDMTGYKSSEEEALRAEVIARKILSEELEGNFDIGSLIGADEKGNLWIYSSEEAKELANRKLSVPLAEYSAMGLVQDTASDPGYHSDDARSETSVDMGNQRGRQDSDSALGMSSPSDSGVEQESSRSYAKTLRLTSDQLKDLSLKPGQNTMSFTVNRATCTASLWLWRFDVPIIISDIDGTITKSDALGHVLNMIGRDWTHLGVAKLYTEIAANGYNFLYLTSRSVGQADTTRAYLAGVVQEGYKLPKGPVIMSPDRTMAALRREVYLRKPEVFKMACLRDIMALFHGTSGSRAMFVDPVISSTEPLSARPGSEPAQQNHLHSNSKSGSPFYAGFGNRLTDAISYRSVNIPSTRIFTINSSSEVSLDLSTLSKYRTEYSSLRDVVDHYFPPVGLLVKGGGEEYTDFNYWRDKPLDIADFSGSDTEEEDDEEEEEEVEMEDEELDEEQEEEDDDDLDEDDDDSGDDERSLPAQTPMFTPGLLSEDEYPGMGDSFVSARPILDRRISAVMEGDSDDEGDGDKRANVEEDMTESLELNEQQRDVQRDLRSDLKGLAIALNNDTKPDESRPRLERSTSRQS